MPGEHVVPKRPSAATGGLFQASCQDVVEAGKGSPGAAEPCRVRHCATDPGSQLSPQRRDFPSKDTMLSH